MKVSLVKHKCTPDCVGYCYAHNRHEPTAGYRVCFECGHVFLTERNLIEAHNRVLAEIRKNCPEAPTVAGRSCNLNCPARNGLPCPGGPGCTGNVGVIPDATSGEQVFCCPFCIHDF